MKGARDHSEKLSPNEDPSPAAARPPLPRFARGEERASALIPLVDAVVLPGPVEIGLRHGRAKTRLDIGAGAVDIDDEAHFLGEDADLAYDDAASLAGRAVTGEVTCEKVAAGSLTRPCILASAEAIASARQSPLEPEQAESCAQKRSRVGIGRMSAPDRRRKLLDLVAKAASPIMVSARFPL